MRTGERRGLALPRSATSDARTISTPSRPRRSSPPATKAQPRGSSEITKTGTSGPSASAILPASDHLSARTKAGGGPQRRRVPQVRPSRKPPASHPPRPDGAQKPQRPAGRGLNGDERRERRRAGPRRRDAQRRRVRSATPRSSTQAPISANTKNQPGIVQCGWPRPPQSGVSVNTTIGGSARQRRNSRRSSARFRQAATRPIASGANEPGRQIGDLAQRHHEELDGLQSRSLARPGRPGRRTTPSRDGRSRPRPARS